MKVLLMIHTIDLDLVFGLHYTFLHPVLGLVVAAFTHLYSSMLAIVLCTKVKIK